MIPIQPKAYYILTNKELDLCLIGKWVKYNGVYFGKLIGINGDDYLFKKSESAHEPSFVVNKPLIHHHEFDWKTVNRIYPTFST